MSALIVMLALGQTYVVPDGHGGKVVGSADQVRQYLDRRAIRGADDAAADAAADAWHARRDAWAADVARYRKGLGDARPEPELAIRAAEELYPLAERARRERARIAAKKVARPLKERDWMTVLERLAAANKMTPAQVDRGLAISEAEPFRDAIHKRAVAAKPRR